MNDMQDIRIHVGILNEEVGILKNDIKWIKKLMLYLAALSTTIVVKSFF